MELETTAAVVEPATALQEATVVVDAAAVEGCER